MKSKSKYNKQLGFSLMETTIYLAVSAIIIFCSLTIMVAMIKKSNEEYNSSFRVNKLYSILNTISDYINIENSKDVSVKDNVIYFTTKNENKKCEISKKQDSLQLRVNDNVSYFNHKNYYNMSISQFVCNQKKNLIYIEIELSTGERMKKCIHINY